MTRLYESVNAVGRSKGERSDCGVIAISIICEVSYDKAYKALERAGRKDRCRVYEGQLQGALNRLGYRIVQVTHKSEMSKPRTTKTIEQETGGRCLVFIANHVAALVEGTLHDWSIERNKRVTHYWKIEKQGD